MYLSKIAGSPSLEVVNLILEKKARGEKVVSLAIGDPSFGTPEEIVNVANQGMLSGDVHYVTSQGTLDVRQAIRAKARKKNAIKAEESNCAFLTTKLAVYASLVAVSEKPFDALVPDPGYFYSEPVILAGGNPIRYSLADDFSLDMDEIRKKTTSNTKAILINSPSNPTGKVLRKGELSELYEYCNEKGIYILSDEAYEDLTYGVEHFSIGSFEHSPEIVVTIFSLSKSYSMTGWRSGYVVASSGVISLITRFLEHTMTCFPPFIEKASAFALNNCDRNISEFKKAYRERRDFMQEKMNDMPELELNSIEGAFYAFPKCKRPIDSVSFAKKLLQSEGVAVLPGIAFGSNGEGRIRLSFSGPMEDIEEGLKRIKKFISTN